MTVGAERRCCRVLDEGDDYRQPLSPRNHVAVGFFAFVAATFLLGWISGLLLVLKSWHLLHATRWLMVSGAGYVTLMLIPIICGFACARIAGHLARRGWSGAPLRVLALGVCGLVAGVMAI